MRSRPTRDDPPPRVARLVAHSVERSRPLFGTAALYFILESGPAALDSWETAGETEGREAHGEPITVWLKFREIWSVFAIAGTFGLGCSPSGGNPTALAHDRLSNTVVVIATPSWLADCGRRSPPRRLAALLSENAANAVLELYQAALAGEPEEDYAGYLPNI